MMPKPPRGPKPLKCLSAQAMGSGLRASNARNSAKAASCISQPAGMSSQSTSQKAAISSQTMWPESAICMCCAVTVQAHQPSKKAAAISSPSCELESHCCRATKHSQAHSVPTVPGATGLKPEPKPSAITCAGCASMKRAVGRRIGAGCEGKASGSFMRNGQRKRNGSAWGRPLHRAVASRAGHRYGQCK